MLDFAKAVGVSVCCTAIVMLCGAPHARDIDGPDATFVSGALFIAHVLSRGILVGATFKCGFHCFDSIVRLFLLFVLGIECEGLFGKVREPKGLASWKTAAFPRTLSSGNTLIQEFWGYHWNRPINRILRDLVFLPSMPYLGKLGAVFLTFFVSGATHLYPLFASGVARPWMIACCMSFFMMQPILIVVETGIPALRSCWWVVATLSITVCFFVEPMLTVCGRGIVE